MACVTRATRCWTGSSESCSRSPAASAGERQLSLCLARLARGQGLGRLLHQVPLDEVAVPRESGRALRFPDPVQVADAPVELLQRVLRRLPIPISLVL